MQPPMRVGINSLFLIPEGVGGSETYVRNVIRELPALDPNIAYTLFTNRENAGTFAVPPGANLRELPCPVHAVRRPERLAYEYGVLPVRARRQHVDVLFSPGFTAPARRGYASVVNILDMQPEDMPENFTPFYHFVHTRLMRRAARAAAHILTLSEHAKRRIVAVYGIPPERITVSPLAAAPIYFTPVAPEAIVRVRQTYGIHAPYILSVATLHPHKNLDALIDAFVALRQATDATMQLVLVGLRGNAAATLQAKIERAGIADTVVMTGWAPDADLPALYQGATVYVLPSRYEGFGIPVLEAMASGTPVITTTAASLPEVAGDAALLVDPDDQAALAQALRRVLDDSSLRADLVGRGKEHAPRFTWRKTAEATLTAFLCARRAHRR
ncbi:MAG: glycosyltransferase family 4 protein [Thermomicrobia bacterium]|nr:glycosyltransferase family 4 protein [Thermomicrobia bacterium]MCA1724587.1 glycosyltransferase family 4 protein [Thermomicrobia bacterium]